MTDMLSADLSRNTFIRRKTSQIKNDLGTLTQEFSSGVSSRITQKLDGDFRELSSIENRLSRLNSYSDTITDYKFRLDVAQNSLTTLRSFGEISNSLISLTNLTDQTFIDSAGQESLSRFEASIRQLNVQAGGRSIFSGVDFDQPAVLEPAAILDILEAEIALAGATTANDIETVVSNWFQDPNGYADVAYTGGATSSNTTRVSETQFVEPIPTAQDVRLVEFVSSMATAALLGRDVLSGQLDEKIQLAKIAGEKIINASQSIVNLQSSIGISQQTMEIAQSEIRAEEYTLESMKSDLIEVDPFEVATKLQAKQTQLESIFAITARLSQIKLTNYI